MSAENGGALEGRPGPTPLKMQQTECMLTGADIGVAVCDRPPSCQCPLGTTGP